MFVIEPEQKLGPSFETRRFEGGKKKKEKKIKDAI